MKQINECFDRFFNNKLPLKKRWYIVDAPGDNIWLFHYTHLILVFNKTTKEIIHEWSSTAADKRGLKAAKDYLTRRFDM
ncbi:hypothetical protein TCA2_5994 [Paenibacillus sp. TCA20]|uniref:hypothetical protein n=1 Tax=Paenibacillus sp. TCA20 TaxID=1499968 RepID=UPI0004D44070|nr:hypothetical protein [Paenibacillus sp. TCA20]GAK43496.1 hypothetical protein TCA2_5994 [Paenibacillus sp. TCA20]